MRTNIVLDDDLVAEAMALTGAASKRQLVNDALREYVHQHKRKNLLELRGKISFGEYYDYKKMREDGSDGPC